MSLRIGIGTNLRIQSNFDWDAYWNQHTSFFGRGRSGVTIPGDYGSDAKILPAVFRGDGSAYYSRNESLISSDDWVLYIDLEILSTVTTLRHCVFTQNGATGMYLRANVTNGYWQFSCTDGTNTRDINFWLGFTARKYSFKIVHNQDGTTEIFESGISQGTAAGTFTHVTTGVCYYATREGMDLMSNEFNLISSRIYSDLAETTLVCSYIFTGQAGVNLFDVSANHKDFTQNTVVAVNSSFSINGSTYLLDSGHALWQKAGSIDIYIPYGGITTAPVAGYTLTKNYLGSATKINMAPCLIGFNETSSAASELAIFDRSNTTRQENISRASAYYSATSLATKCRYHISEVYPYEVYNAWFKAAYKDIFFTSISKSGSDFSITEFIGSTEQQTGNALINRKQRSYIDSLLTVGTDKNVRTISQAVSRSYDDYTITIDAGTYDELVDLTTKKINLVGLGSLTTLIKPQYPGGVAPFAAVRVSTDSTFNNILFDKIENTATPKANLLINGCSPIFTNCQVGVTGGSAIQSAYPMDISNGSVVTMNNCQVHKSDDDCNLIVKDTSQLIFEGTYFSAHLLVQDTAIVNIDVDIFQSQSSNNTLQGLFLEDDAQATIRVNTSCNGVYAFNLIDDSHLTLSGSEIIGGVNIAGAGNVVLLKDIISHTGWAWINTSGAAITADITIDNCQLYCDADNDVSGLHVIEETVGAEIKIINGSVLEFSGHDGVYLTMGSPIVCAGKIYLRNSSVIDHVNDNIPFGVNYLGSLSCHRIDAEDSVITNTHWDSVGTNHNILINKVAGDPLQIRLKNVVLNNSEIDTSPIYLQQDVSTLEVGDYACIENVTNNTTKPIFDASAGDAVAAWATLLAACP